MYSAWLICLKRKFLESMNWCQKWMLLRSHSHPHDTTAGWPTHTYTYKACMHVQTHTSMHSNTRADCVCFSCMSSSYVERIFDLSQEANQLLHYLHLVSWVCWLLGPSPASDAGYRGSQREIHTHSSLWERVCVWICACMSLCCCCERVSV